eukprot:scaffold132658_cov27-Phaeocystis_antarctica.AAC.1
MQYEGAAEGAPHLPRSLVGQAGHHREAGAAHMARDRARARGQAGDHREAGAAHMARGRARARARPEKQALRLTPHASRLTPHASRLTPHASHPCAT